MSESLKDKTARGLFWGAMSNGTTQLLNIVIGIVLGRLLTPDDYGLVGVLTIFTLIAGNLQSSGFSQALVNLKQPRHDDYNSVFWFNVLASVAIYALLFACAPLIAWYFDDHRLVTLSRFVFLCFVVSSVGIVHSAYMIKNMMNREMAIISALALLSSGTAGVTLAFCGATYWALAWQQLVFISVLNVGRYYYTRWTPSLHIDFGPVRKMFTFSVKILITNILNTLSANLLTFFFGRLYALHDVGNYTQANNWSTKASSFVSGTLAQIAQPVMAQVNDDRAKAQAVFRKMTRFTAFLSMPLMLGLALVAREFILITIHEQWLESVPLLQLLCIGGAFMPLYTLYQNLAISSGRSDIYLWTNVSQIVALIGVLVVFHPYGMTTMVKAYTVMTILWVVVWHMATQRILGLSLLALAADVMPFLLAAGGAMAVAWVATRGMENLWLLLLTRAVAGGGSYIVVMKLARVKMLDECLQFIRKKR